MKRDPDDAQPHKEASSQDPSPLAPHPSPRSSSFILHPSSFRSSFPPDSRYDVIVIGGGLAGLTAANTLARAGHSVLLLEQHDRLGGYATWFGRPGGHVFDVSLHGFPYGMVKSCRRYWTGQIADSIVQLRDVRVENPMFSLSTTFERGEVIRILADRFRVAPDRAEEFFRTIRTMGLRDDPAITTRDLFDRFFPGREDVLRLLMEPVAYVGSTLEDPALTYAIVFSLFSAKGVYTFTGGTQRLIGLMEEELRRNGVHVCRAARAERICTAARRVEGVCLSGRTIHARAVISNANLKATILQLVGPEHFDPEFVDAVRAMRLNHSSTQVYIGLKPGEPLDRRRCGDMLFSSSAPVFCTEQLLSPEITSRTYSFYAPATSSGGPQIVVTANARHEDWAGLGAEEYRNWKRRLVETALDAVGQYVPDVRRKLDWVECATPRTFERYTGHWGGSSFGTKFEGLQVHRRLPHEVAGLYHAGSVGIIRSGWLGAVNCGVIVANAVDEFLARQPSPRARPRPSTA